MPFNPPKILSDTVGDGDAEVTLKIDGFTNIQQNNIKICRLKRYRIRRRNSQYVEKFDKTIIVRRGPGLEPPFEDMGTVFDYIERPGRYVYRIEVMFRPKNINAAATNPEKYPSGSLSDKSRVVFVPR